MLLKIPAVLLKNSPLNMPLLQHLGGYPKKVPEVTRKMTLIGETDLISDLTDGELTGCK